MQNLNNTYPKQPDPNVDYGEPNLPECTCGECGLVWETEDIDDMGRCGECRPVQATVDRYPYHTDGFSIGVKK
jgi:hypothetical protein